MADSATALRREAIRTLLRGGKVGTQEELRALLEKKGHEVTQATLSRDLAKLGARRVARPSGGTVYELPDAGPATAEDALRAAGELVTFVEDGDAIVVLGTRPGGASTVAVALDRARIPEILGTLAGDDTIFVSPARGVRPRDLVKSLKKLWEKGGRQS